MQKDVGNDTITPWQKIHYKYNIRGWLTDINNVDSLSIGSDPDDLFAFKINYNSGIQNSVSGDVTRLFNGNIAETTWITLTDNIKRRYGYKYDPLNRLLASHYQKPELTNPTTGSYNEHMTYDKNGNIQTLQRYGDFDSNDLWAIQIDDLDYDYDTDNKNLLKKVTDLTISPKGFKNAAGLGDDYTYDDHGNMTSDRNKSIDSIVYNHLNLPTRIVFANDNKIEYLYDATGKKLGKKVIYADGEIVTEYLDGFQYVDGELVFFSHAEGYVNVRHCEECSPKGSVFNYVFQYKDHLGNIRVSYGHDDLESELAILEENHYYPLGLKHTNYNVDTKEYTPSPDNPEITSIEDLPPGEQLKYKYKYNGKEYQDELGLNLYDYGARNYDPALGRWMNIDPLAEQSRRFSPYTYALNNPVYFIDPDGMEAEANDMSGTLEKDDYEKKVDVGYGRMVSVDRISSSLEFSGGGINLTEKGEKKFEAAALNDAIADVVNNGGYQSYQEKGAKGKEILNFDITLLDRFEGSGIDPFAGFDSSIFDESVADMMEKIKGLKEYYQSSGSPRIMNGGRSTKGYRGLNDAEGIHMYWGSMTYNYVFVSTLFHEISHEFGATERAAYSTEWRLADRSLRKLNQNNFYYNPNRNTGIWSQIFINQGMDPKKYPY